jgi:Uma2 family endonuclease
MVEAQGRPYTYADLEAFPEDLYERGGVREYWIVHPEERWVETLRLADGVFVPVATLRADRHDVLTTPVLPGFSLELMRLFA